MPVFAHDHVAWQFLANVDLSGMEGDDLADLRYAVGPG
jgi:hypothetical protein